NDTKTDYAKGKCIHELFETQVKATPNNIAVVYDDQKLTYEQLNQKANQLAHYLISLGVGSDLPVALSFENPLQMVIGFFGIVKAGGVYIPLDPTHPKKRLACMLDDMEATILLTETSLVDKFAQFKGTVVPLDEEKDKIDSFPHLNPSVRILP